MRWSRRYSQLNKAQPQGQAFEAGGYVQMKRPIGAQGFSLRPTPPLPNVSLRLSNSTRCDLLWLAMPHVLAMSGVELSSSGGLC